MASPCALPGYSSVDSFRYLWSWKNGELTPRNFTRALPPAALERAASPPLDDDNRAAAPQSWWRLYRFFAALRADQGNRTFTIVAIGGSMTHVIAAPNM